MRCFRPNWDDFKYIWQIESFRINVFAKILQMNSIGDRIDWGIFDLGAFSIHENLLCLDATGVPLSPFERGFALQSVL